MADVTVKTFDKLDSYEGMFLYAAKGLGVTAWGMNVLKLPAKWTEYPEHDHMKDGQEEVYVVLEGAAKLEVADESWDLRPGSLAFVAPGEKRVIIPGEEGVTLLALGGTPGKPYEPSS